MKLRVLLPAAALLLAACAANAPKLSSPPAIAKAAMPEPDVVTAGDLQPTDIDLLVQSGVRHVIDLRVDAETPDFNEASAVRDAGLAYDNLEIRGAEDLTLENVQKFDALLRGADLPVVVHCGSSNRVGALAALRAAWIQGKSPQEALAIGRSWGLNGLEPAVREKLAANP